MPALSHRDTIALPLLLTIAACGGGASAPSASAHASFKALAAQDCNVVPNRELVITALPVVDAPVRTAWDGTLQDANQGAWHIGRLLTRMAGTNNPQTFVSNWFGVIGSENKMPLVDAWPQNAAQQPNLTQAPLHLLAIVNRLDLRADPNQLGELRFVYGTLANPNTSVDSKVIVECGVRPSAEFPDAQSWAQGWHVLAGATQWDDASLAQLTHLTSSVVDGEHLSCRIRTADEAFGSDWTFRQFEMDQHGQLQPAALSLTPDIQLNSLRSGVSSDPNTPMLADFINTRTPDILKLAYTMPQTWRDVDISTPDITIPVDYGGQDPNVNGRTWNIPGVQDANALKVFSFNTCNGCHSANEDIIPAQITNRFPGAESQLSQFFLGPQAELARRTQYMQAVLCDPNHLPPSGDVLMPVLTLQ